MHKQLQAVITVLSLIKPAMFARVCMLVLRDDAKREYCLPALPWSCYRLPRK
jgi:hypothetical protein